MNKDEKKLPKKEKNKEETIKPEKVLKKVKKIKKNITSGIAFVHGPLPILGLPSSLESHGNSFICIGPESWTKLPLSLSSWRMLKRASNFLQTLTKKLSKLNHTLQNERFALRNHSKMIVNQLSSISKRRILFMIHSKN